MHSFYYINQELCVTTNIKQKVISDKLRLKRKN
jgi:hypothetical protein